MPTYQTAPLLPILFPDQVARLNYVAPLKGNTIALADLPAPGPAYHPEWRKQADASVLAGLHANKIKNKQFLHGWPSIKGNHAFTTFRGEHNHAFHGPYHGGVITTKRGQTILGELLKNRISQLDAIAAASFDAAPSAESPFTISEESTYDLDKTFKAFVSALSEGVISSDLFDYTEYIMNYFLEYGDTIPTEKFGDYSQLLTNMLPLISALLSEYPSDRTKRAILNRVSMDIRDMFKFIREFEEYSAQPSKAKAAKLAAIRSKLLKDTVADTRNAAHYSSLRSPRRKRASAPVSSEESTYPEESYFAFPPSLSALAPFPEPVELAPLPEPVALAPRRSRTSMRLSL